MNDNLSSLPFPDAMEKIGMTLVMNIGGAAGPLYGTLLMEIGRELRRTGRRRQIFPWS